MPEPERDSMSVEHESVSVEPAGTKKRRAPVWNIILFIATLATTWSAGALGETYYEAFWNGLIYMASVVGILLCHEMGHYFMARRNKVDASLPFFIPFPLSLFGTLGAVIVMRGRIRSRNALMEVGAAGPLAGMAVAVPILLIGLSMSPVAPLSPGGIMEGQSLLYMLLKLLAVGPIPDGYDVYLHPMAWAGWIGLLVTMLNLLPIGQLDGGHISFALWGEKHAAISRMVIIGIFVLGFFVVGHGVLKALDSGITGEDFWLQVSTRGNWFFLGAMLFFFFGRGKRRNHPPTDDNTLSPRHRAVGFACLALFALTFTPLPIQILY